MELADFDYDLPPDQIAQIPAAIRDLSRLLVLDRRLDQHSHTRFRELPDRLRPGDLLVLNDSRVIAARLRATKRETGARIEVLLTEEMGRNDWRALLRPGKRVRPGTCLRILGPAGEYSAWTAVVSQTSDEGLYRIHFEGQGDVLSELEELGETPLPPYIVRPPGTNRLNDRERYQTVYARADGSVAAPTAGLHFSAALVERLHQRGVSTAFVTLHVGHATFAPVKTSRIADHTMHEEVFRLSPESAQQINRAKAEGKRVIAVGTTTLRVLEHVSGQKDGRLEPMVGSTRLFIYPPYRFHTVDALITNFHVPRSTLLMLVSAFADPGGLRGRDRILRAYTEAVRRGYRFFSYGDAMLIESSVR